MEKIKSLAEYQPLAHRTLNDLGTYEANAIHMEAGITGEMLGEVVDILKGNFAYKKPLDLVHLGEEIGDTSWFAINTFTLNNITFCQKEEDSILIYRAEIKENNAWERKDKVHAALSFILSNKHFFDVMNPHNMLMLIAMCQELCEIFGLDYYQILTTNIKKLQLRYPEKFTEDAAINRNLEAERKVLEEGSETKEE